MLQLLGIDADNSQICRIARRSDGDDIERSAIRCIHVIYYHELQCFHVIQMMNEIYFNQVQEDARPKASISGFHNI
jgi:hypothetical protein